MLFKRTNQIMTARSYQMNLTDQITKIAPYLRCAPISELTSNSNISTATYEIIINVIISKLHSQREFKLKQQPAYTYSNHLLDNSALYIYL